jgi:succinate dehydrogenase / fumarate reductase cytochrome b subunit
MATTTRPTEVKPVNPIRRGRRLPWFLDLYQTAVGKKFVMAVTGIFGLLFVAGHMVGNVKGLYMGGHHLDEYGEWLRTVGEPALPFGGFLWLMRAGLIGAVLLHIHAAWSLTRMNARSDVKYVYRRDFAAANFASRTMRWTGIIVGLFILFHLADLTWGPANPDFIRGSVRHNLFESFDRVPVAILYIVANTALGIHLWHGCWSLFQSMGWNNPRFNQWRSWFAWGFAGAITLGNVSMPLAVMTGAIKL